MSKRVVRDERKVQRKTDQLVRMGEGNSDDCHESNPSSQTITTVPSICRIRTAFMMGWTRQRNPEPECHVEDSARTRGKSSRVTNSVLVAVSYLQKDVKTPGTPISRTRTTTGDQQTSLLAGSGKRVLGVRCEGHPRVRCHRTPRPRGTLARRTAWVKDSVQDTT